MPGPSPTYKASWAKDRFESEISTIARLDSATKKWSKVGELANARQGHLTIMTSSDSVFMLGNWFDDLPAETCTFKVRVRHDF